MEASPVFMKDFQQSQFYCTTDQHITDLSSTTILPFMTTGFEQQQQPIQHLTIQDLQQNNCINSANIFANYPDIYSLCALNQEAKENENSASRLSKEIKAEYNGSSFSELSMIKEIDQQKQQQQLIQKQSQNFNNSYNNNNNSQIEVNDNSERASATNGSDITGKKMIEQQTDTGKNKERSKEADTNNNNSFTTKSPIEQNHNQQQQNQGFHPPSISVIVSHQQQQITNENFNKNNKQMDDDCWNIGGINSEVGNNVSSMLIRDEFIFQPTHCGSPPPTTTIIGGRNDGGNTDFLYDLSTTSNPLLEDTFLTSMHNNSNSSPLDNIPCSSNSFLNCTSASSAFLELQHHGDGSVGVSPCSSSTHNSVSSPDEYSLFLAQQQQQHFLQHGNIKQHFPHLLSPAIDNIEILRPIPQLIEGHSVVGQTIDMQQQQYAFLVQQHAQNSIQAIFTNEQQQQHQTSTMTQRKDENRAEVHERRNNHSDDEYDDEDDEEEMEDERVVNQIESKLTDVKPTLILGGNNTSSTFIGEDSCIGDYTLSPPPPPLTPPSKTRSKMHDLALKHRLISSQNLRGNGTIQLSMEEKKTLIQEGFPVPTRLPLVREEEEALKIVRRKIKNKLSAQESRRKRKEYMDMLEKRVHAYFADNNALRQKLRQLEASNRFLLIQLQQKSAAEGTNTTNNEEHPHQ